MQVLQYRPQTKEENDSMYLHIHAVILCLCLRPRCAQSCKWHDSLVLDTRVSSQSLYLADEFQHSHLQDVSPMRYIVHLTQQVMNCSVLCMVAQHQECIALCGQVLLAVEHFLYQVWCVLQVLLALGELVYGVDGQDSIASHIRMPVLQACENGGYQWLKDLLFPYST